MTKKVIALIALVLAVIGMAHAIETHVRPDTGRQGQKVSGGHED